MLPIGEITLNIVVVVVVVAVVVVVVVTEMLIVFEVQWLCSEWISVQSVLPGLYKYTVLLTQYSCLQLCYFHLYTRSAGVHATFPSPVLLRLRRLVLLLLLLLYYYAALLPRRGRILRRTLSVCLSVRPVIGSSFVILQ